MPIVQIHNSGESFEQSDEHVSILSAGLGAGFGLSYECNSGGCGSCKFELIKGEVEELWPEAHGLTSRDLKKGRKLACQCRAKTDLVISMRTDDSFRPLNAPQRFSARLASRRELTPDITEFRFIGQAPARFLPGQYAMLSLPGSHHSRAYSMSNLANDDGIWDFWIRRKPAGQMTEQLFARLQVGNEVELESPFGLAYLKTSAPRDVVCIAGGSGISPVLSIARGVLSDPAMAGRKVHFFFGGRTPADICGLEELKALPGFAQRIHFHAAISEPQPEGDWKGAVGYIHETVKQVLKGSWTDYEYYLAGPPSMVQAATKMLLLDQCVPAGQVHFDRFF